MNQKFVISGIAAAVLGAAASAYASGTEFKLPETSQAVVQKSTLSFFNLGSAEKAYDGSTDLNAVGTSDNIRTVVLSTQKRPSDKVSTSEGGVLNVHAKDVKLVHHDAKARSILLSASADDKSPIRSQSFRIHRLLRTDTSRRSALWDRPLTATSSTLPTAHT